jgi:hypothetical protein
MDEVVSDPARPQAFPSKYPMDLMGRIRVRLCAEDRNLVAYGFGGQRVALPAMSVGAVHTVTSFRTGRVTHGQALLVLDRDNRILLRADGMWETYGEVEKVCRAAEVPKPTHVRLGSGSGTKGGSRAQRRRRSTRPPLFAKAEGYVKLRTSPRGTSLYVLAVIVLFLGAAGTLAPARRFFGRRREHPAGWLAAANLGLVFLVVALIGWGPGVGIASLTHGFRDSSLVAQLRANGVTFPGRLIDEPDYSTDNDGKPTVTDVPTLSFLGHETTDPSIGGRPLPLDASDPLNTDQRETVVFLPLDPDVAAAKQQITGSVWHGAPTANLISGGLFTLALPALVWLLVLRVRRRRWRRAREFVDDLTT